MPAETRRIAWYLRRAIAGNDRDQSKRVLLLSAGFFLAYALGTYLGHTYRSASVLLEMGIHIMNTPYGLIIDLSPVLGFSYLWAGWGAVLVVGLALVASFHDGGYIPSLVLSAAPGAGYYLFRDPPPVEGWGIPIQEDLVIVPPGSMAVHLLPEVLIFGTIGFVLGVLLRRRYRKSADESTPEPSPHLDVS